MNKAFLRHFRLIIVLFFILLGLALFLILPRMSYKPNGSTSNIPLASYPLPVASNSPEITKTNIPIELSYPYPPYGQVTLTLTPSGPEFTPCTFWISLPREKNIKSNLENFRVTEPGIVQQSEIVLGIGDWLLNSEGLILERRLKEEGYLSIELFNVKDNSSKVLGKARDFWDLMHVGSQPGWIITNR